MSESIKLKLLFPVLIIFALVGSVDYFAESEIKVSSFVDKTKISLDDFINFTIKIEGIEDDYSNPEIKLPKLEDNFIIVATSQSNSFSVKGANTQIVWQLQYSLQPKNTGEIKIESVEVIYQGNTYQTDEILITVSPSHRLKPKERYPEQELPKKAPWQDKEGIYI